MKRPCSHNIYAQASVTWLMYLPLVIVNGIVREVVYKPWTGALLAHQISTIIAAVAFLLLVYYRMRRELKKASRMTLFRIGFLWVSMTILFEIALGYFVMGATWDQLFFDYNILEGRIWTLLLLVQWFTPAIVKQMDKNITPNQYQYSK